MKYNFQTIQQNINYLKTVYWYRQQYTRASLNNLREVKELYKTKEFLVVNKPHDLVVYNHSKHQTHSLVNILRDQYPVYYDPRVKGGFRILHRLDTVSSGCICIPLTPFSMQEGYKAFLNHNAQKYYLALVYGHVQAPISQDWFEIDVPVGDDENNIGYLITTKYDRSGALIENCINAQKATTLVKVLEHGTYNDRPCSKVMLKLVTGRRHQLRVHLKHMGHPIVGDTYYGIDDYDTYRTMLHAYSFKMKLERNVIEAIAEDPFTNEMDECWKPGNILNKIN